MTSFITHQQAEKLQRMDDALRRAALSQLVTFTINADALWRNQDIQTMVRAEMNRMMNDGRPKA